MGSAQERALLRETLDALRKQHTAQAQRSAQRGAQRGAQRDVAVARSVVERRDAASTRSSTAIAARLHTAGASTSTRTALKKIGALRAAAAAAASPSSRELW